MMEDYVSNLEAQAKKRAEKSPIEELLGTAGQMLVALQRIATVLERAYPVPKPPRAVKPRQVSAEPTEPVLLFSSIPGRRGTRSPRAAAGMDCCDACRAGTEVQCNNPPDKGSPFCAVHKKQATRSGTVEWKDV